MNGFFYQLRSSTLITALIISSCVKCTAEQLQTCSQIFESSTEEDDKVLLCHLYETSLMMAQLGAFVYKDIQKFLANKDVTVEEDTQNIEKRKHEYLRFGKRKHEYLRFGKRKHEYLRFGRM